MATIVHEIKVISTGFPGAPGFTTFYFNGEDSTDRDNQFRHVKAFLELAKGLFPNTWSAAVQAEGRVLTASSGVLDTTTTVPADGTANPSVGTAAVATFGAGAAGICISYTTTGINRGRRVRGRTYLVPISAGVYGPDGTIDNAFLAGIRTAFQTWATDPLEFGVWSRPREGSGGVLYPVDAVSIKDKAAVLTSRRQ